MDLLLYLISCVNAVANLLGKYVLGFIVFLPGWLSITIISAVTGVVLLILFKYTSNQTAIGKVRNGIKANLLAIKLFKDSIAVTLQSEMRVFAGAGLLLFHAIVPMLVMMVPMSLLLVQMGLWYQYRPLEVGEETLVVMKLASKETPLKNVKIESLSAAKIIAGPVRVPSKNEVYWKIKASDNGNHTITFNVANKQIEKQLAVSEGFMRISPKRPSQHWSDVLLNPVEKPLASDLDVESISIDYPKRISKISGADWWVVYFFAASMVFAFIFKPLLKVNI